MIAPPCLHFGQCGGCTLQHLDDDTVAAMKRARVVDALAQSDIEAPVADVQTVPAHSRRRVKLSYQRTKKTALFGFYEAQSSRIVPISVCPVTRPEIVDALLALANLAGAGAPRKRAISVTVTLCETGLDVAVEEGKQADLALREHLSACSESADLARLSWNGEVIAMHRPPRQRFGRAFVVPPPGAFLQASSEGENILRNFVQDAVGDAGSVADLFAGCGTFTLPLAETASVTAVESEADMITALDEGWRHANGLKQVTAIARDLFRRPLQAIELDSFDAVIFDPPRAGAKAQASELAKSNVPTVVGVSCMPSSFARDAAILVEGGYRLEKVLPVDQFRWSPHVELAGVFRRD